MPDLSDVTAQLATIAAAACYPNGTGSPSIAGVDIRIFEGWPVPAQLDADIAAGKINVSVYPVPNATAVVPQLTEQAYTIVAPVHGMTLAASGQSVTITGNPNVGEYLTLIVNRAHTYSYPAISGDTSGSVATAVAALVAVDFPGVAAVANIITLPANVFEIVARIGAVGTMGHVIHRQKQQIKVSVWATNSALRASVAAPLDIALKQNLKLTFSDTSQGVMTYQNTMNDDNPQKVGLYVRHLTYAVEYATLEQYPAWEVTSVTLTFAPLDEGSALDTQTYLGTGDGAVIATEGLWLI